MTVGDGETLPIKQEPDHHGGQTQGTLWTRLFLHSLSHLPLHPSLSSPIVLPPVYSLSAGKLSRGSNSVHYDSAVEKASVPDMPS